ncbi:MAG: hypothetical protein JOZ75_06000, partial [Candidatus Dormibacteraeota bacterium]|nr:hypothetical protein [Candidatus Dormibacteraeota bacterium]
LFLFALVCLVADTAFLFRCSSSTQSAAQLAAQSGADAVDPHYLYGASVCTPPARSPCSAAIVDISSQDRQGALYSFQRACIQAGDQSAEITQPRGGALKTADDPQNPDGTACASDGCRVVAVVTRTVTLPIPIPGFATTVNVRGQFYAAPVVGAAQAQLSCTGGAWVPAPPPSH